MTELVLNKQSVSNKRSIANKQALREKINNKLIRSELGAGSGDVPGLPLSPARRLLINQAINIHLNGCYMKYVKGPGSKSKSKKPAEKKEEAGLPEQLVTNQIVNQQEQDQVTNNHEENSSVLESEPDQKPDFPKEIN